jgi:hypothetical protein
VFRGMAWRVHEEIQTDRQTYDREAEESNRGDRIEEDWIAQG